LLRLRQVGCNVKSETEIIYRFAFREINGLANIGREWFYGPMINKFWRIDPGHQLISPLSRFILEPVRKDEAGPHTKQAHRLHGCARLSPSHTQGETPADDSRSHRLDRVLAAQF
jgi:hypothetical protein